LGAMCGWRGTAGALSGRGATACPANAGRPPALGPCGMGTAAAVAARTAARLTAGILR
jgi:hypothetical protein